MCVDRTELIRERKVAPIDGVATEIRPNCVRTFNYIRYRTSYVQVYKFSTVTFNDSSLAAR